MPSLSKQAPKSPSSPGPDASPPRAPALGPILEAETGDPISLSSAADAAVATASDAPAQPGEHWAALGMPNEDDNAEPDNSDADSAIGTIITSTSTASISESILEYRTVYGRTYHSDRKAGENLYWGPNDERQNEGLDIMHHAHTLLLDGQLHQAPLQKENLEKAIDIGTGTGIWAVDFADLYPDCRVIGTDLSPIQPGWVPVNCTFQIDDATQEWTFAENSLDYVHMRWLVGAIVDWDHVAEQAYRCLKPGGWFEWFECDGHYESDDGTVNKKTAVSQWSHIFQDGARAMGSTASYFNVRDNVAPRVFSDAGFVNYDETNTKVVVGTWPKDPKFKEVGRFAAAGIETDIEGYVSYMASKLGWSKEAVAIYSAHCRKEIRSGKVHLYYRCKNAWGQKPVSKEENQGERGGVLMS